MAGAEEPPHISLADRNVARREIEKDFGAGQSGVSRGRQRRPNVLAYLDMKRERRESRRAEEEIDAEGSFASGDRRLPADNPGARGEMPPLVELAIVRQIGLRRDSKDGAAMDNDGRVVEPTFDSQRRAEHERRKQILRSRRDP